VSDLAYIVEVRAKAGKSNLLGAALAEMVTLSRQEPGCRICELHQSSDEAALWMVYERWQDKEAFESHMQQPYTLRFIERMGDLASEPADVRAFDHTT
jgi:quinol monooxygenase YgiN